MLSLAYLCTVRTWNSKPVYVIVEDINVILALSGEDMVTVVDAEDGEDFSVPREDLEGFRYVGIWDWLAWNIAV